MEELTSDEYELWENISIKIKKLLDDVQDDIYELWDDLTDDMLDNDINAAKEELQEFKEDINKLERK